MFLLDHIISMAYLTNLIILLLSFFYFFDLAYRWKNKAKYKCLKK
jgi:hypothetical protein